MIIPKQQKTKMRKLIAIFSGFALLAGFVAVVAIFSVDKSVKAEVKSAFVSSVDTTKGDKTYTPRVDGPDKNGVSYLEDILASDVPAEHTIIGLNIGLLGTSLGSPVVGLQEETLAKIKALPSDTESLWKVGVVGQEGSASEGHITLILDDIRDADAIRNHLMEGLTPEQVANVGDFLSFDTTRSGALIADLAAVNEQILSLKWLEGEVISLEVTTLALEGKERVTLEKGTSNRAIKALQAISPYIEIVTGAEPITDASGENPIAD
jgi:hypothetical protein